MPQACSACAAPHCRQLTQAQSGTSVPSESPAGSIPVVILGFPRRSIPLGIIVAGASVLHTSGVTPYDRLRWPITAR